MLTGKIRCKLLHICIFKCTLEISNIMDIYIDSWIIYHTHDDNCN